MRSTRDLWTTYSVPTLLLVVVAALGVVSPASAQPPPENRSYEITVVLPPFDGNDEETNQECLTFTEDEVCLSSLEVCAPWIFLPVQGDKRPGFKAIVQTVDDDGTLVEFHFRGFTERRGEPESSIGGVIVAVASDEDERVVLNFGFVGRQVTDCSAFPGGSE